MAHDFNIKRFTRTLFHPNGEESSALILRKISKLKAVNDFMDRSLKSKYSMTVVFVEDLALDLSI